jgi:hypothetical protein
LCIANPVPPATICRMTEDAPSPETPSRLSSVYVTCPACQAIRSTVTPVCEECGLDAEGVFHGDPSYHRAMAPGIGLLIGAIFAAGLIFACLAAANKSEVENTEMPGLLTETSPGEPAINPDDIPLTNIEDLNSEGYVSSLVDSRMARDFPLLDIGDEVKIDVDGTNLSVQVIKLERRQLFVLTDDGKQRISYHALDAEVRLRCDTDYRAEYRRRNIRAMVRQRKERFKR